MKIAVMGAGAMGGYIGGRLAAAGHDVALIARGAHLAAIREKGLRIKSLKGDLHLTDIVATDDPADVGPVDVVLFMVKNYDVELSARAVMPMVGPDTMVVTFQNGVTAPDVLARVIGHKHVVPGVARFPADIMEPGVIRHNATFDALVFGESDGVMSKRCQAFCAALVAAGPVATVSEMILHDLWVKMVMQASLASITALTRLDLGPLRSNPNSAALFRQSMIETELVGRAVVPSLPADTAQEQWAFIQSVPGHIHASMQDDLLRGKPIEVNYLSGEVVRLGRENGVETPIHSVLWAALQPFVDGAPGGSETA